jgi:hypothetical protein
MIFFYIFLSHDTKSENTVQREGERERENERDWQIEKDTELEWEIGREIYQGRKAGRGSALQIIIPSPSLKTWGVWTQRNFKGNSRKKFRKFISGNFLNFYGIIFCDRPNCVVKPWQAHLRVKNVRKTLHKSSKKIMVMHDHYFFDHDHATTWTWDTWLC